MNRNRILTSLEQNKLYNFIRPMHLKARSVIFNWKFKKAKKNDYKLPFPTDFVMEATPRCNLRCKMCFFDRNLTVKSKEMDIKELKSMFDRLPSMKRINLTGGEPFVKQELFDIIKYLETKGVFVFITSNGTLINEEKAEKLKHFKNMDGIGISLDGTKETHNIIRNANYAFDSAINSVKLLKNDMFIVITTVFQEDNIHQLSDLINLLADLGFNHFLLEHERRYIKEDIDESAKALGFPVSSFELRFNDTLNPGYSFEELKKALQEAEKTAKKRGVKIYYLPEIFKKRMGDCYNFKVRDKGRYFCREMFKARIDARGNVFHCPAIRHNFGNILEKPFEEIWNSKEHRAFRRRLTENNLVPICKTCLYMERIL